MKKEIKMFLVLIIIIVILYFFYNQTNTVNQVCFESNCFDVEIASTYEERSKGLMFRESLKENQGMLFIFKEENIYSFWMKNTLIPLDIIWINKDKEVIHIETAQPCESDPCPSYSPPVLSLYVLELNANTSKKINLNINDTIEIK